MPKFFDRDEVEDLYFSALRDEDKSRSFMTTRRNKHKETKENTLGISARKWHYVFVYDYIQQGDNPYAPACFGSDAVRLGSCVTAGKMNRLINTSSPGLVFLSVGNGRQRVMGELWRVSGDTILDMDRWKIAAGFFTRTSICVKIDPQLQDNKNHQNGVWAWVYTMHPDEEARIKGKVIIPTEKIRGVGEVSSVAPMKWRDTLAKQSTTG